MFFETQCTCTPPAVGERRIAMSVFVRLSVRSRISRTACLNFIKFWCMLRVAVARSSSGKLSTLSSVLFFSRPPSEGWPHHGRTFSLYPLSTSGFVDDVTLPIIDRAEVMRVGRILKMTHRGQHGFDTAVHTQADLTGKHRETRADLGRSRMSIRLPRDI